MLEFSSIASYLQVKIAEKIGYYDLMQFELASKRAAQTVALAKHKPILSVYEIRMNENEINFAFEVPWKRDRVEVDWSNIRRMKDLPRFKVRVLNPGNISFLYVLEFIEHADFCENEVVLTLFEASPNLEIVDKLAQTFNITEMRMYKNPNEIINLPWVRELKSVTIIRIDSIPDEKLLQLTASTLDFELFECSNSRLSTLSNQFFQQWSQKTRNIKRLSISAINDFNDGEMTGNVLNKEILLNGLSFTEISGGYVGSTIFAGMSDDDESGGFFTIEENFEAYLIDREDGNQLICVSDVSDCDGDEYISVSALEVTEVFISGPNDFYVSVIPSE